MTSERRRCIQLRSTGLRGHLLSRSPFVGPRAAEDVLHRIVPLVARVLEELIFRMQLQRQRYGPWPRPGLQIGDGRGVLQRLCVDALESLDDFQILGRWQRVAVPS